MYYEVCQVFACTPEGEYGYTEFTTQDEQWAFVEDEYARAISTDFYDAVDVESNADMFRKTINIIYY